MNTIYLSDGAKTSIELFLDENTSGNGVLDAPL